MTNHDQPTATNLVLRQRARLVAEIRRYFDNAGYYEVETPLLSADTVVDAWLDPFVAEWIPDATRWNQRGQPRFLQTSPEFAMKRLLVAGADCIYQLGKVFRNGELGDRHNPEFTMLEWYRVGQRLSELMALTEQLVQQVFVVARELNPTDEQVVQLAEKVGNPGGFLRLTYTEAFEGILGENVLDCSMAALRGVAERRNTVPPPGLDDHDRDGWLNFLLAEFVEPRLGFDCPVFLTDYPPSQAALARLSDDGKTAQRFELYIRGIELCNGYDELTDTTILQKRIQEQLVLRRNAGLRPLPETSLLLKAMEMGLPECAGNALGVDRLMMLALGKSKLSEVIPFPFPIA